MIPIASDIDIDISNIIIILVLSIWYFLAKTTKFIDNIKAIKNAVILKSNTYVVYEDNTSIPSIIIYLSNSLYLSFVVG